MMIFEKGNPFELGSDKDFLSIYSNTGEQSGKN